jgi:hypothetical protein
MQMLCPIAVSIHTVLERDACTSTEEGLKRICVQTMKLDFVLLDTCARMLMNLKKLCPQFLSYFFAKIHARKLSDRGSKHNGHFERAHARILSQMGGARISFRVHFLMKNKLQFYFLFCGFGE